MTKSNTIKIDEIEYIRKDAQQTKYVGDPKGYHVVVLDRGFMFHGNLTIDDTGLHTLTDCVNIRKWKTGGTGGVIKSSRDSGATLDPCADIRFREPILIAPVDNDWR